jgi:hypothetical protein
MERMRDVLRGSLGRSLRELPDEDRLAAAWPVACGSALAGHSEVLYLDAEGVLHVRSQTILAVSLACGSTGYTSKSRVADIAGRFKNHCHRFRSQDEHCVSFR